MICLHKVIITQNFNIMVTGVPYLKALRAITKSTHGVKFIINSKIVV